MDNSTDIQDKLDRFLVEYESNITAWAKAKALHEKSSDMKKVSLNVVKSSLSGTNAAREMEAYASKEFADKQNETFTNACLFYSLDARKKFLEISIDVLRSKLSFSKTMINLTQ